MRRQDVVAVQNYSATVGNIGQTKYTTPDGDVVNVDCNVYPLSAEEVTAYGLQLIDSRTLVCDAWPGNVHSRITFEGAEWDQHAPPKTFNKTVASRSVQVVIKKRG